MFENNSPSTYTSTNTGVESTFFGKVMGFFALAIFTSFAGTYITMTYFMHLFVNMPYLMYVFFAVELLIIFTAKTWSKKTPINRFLFAGFAFISGITIAPLISIVLTIPAGPAILAKALIATGFMFTATALIGYTTKKSLSGMRGFLMMALIGMIIVSVLGIFIPWGNTFELVFSGFGIIIFSGFTMYDFQKIKSYPEDMYIEAALALYLDIFNLFIYILRLLLAFGRD